MLLVSKLTSQGELATENELIMGKREGLQTKIDRGADVRLLTEHAAVLFTTPSRHSFRR